MLFVPAKDDTSSNVHQRSKMIFKNIDIDIQLIILYDKEKQQILSFEKLKQQMFA